MKPLRLLYHLIALLIFWYLFFITLQPLSDPDLFWHLKTGQWISYAKSLPGHEDPFSYTSPERLSEDKVKALRGNWLSQVALYIIYFIGGYPALSIFRTLLIVLPFAYLYIRFTRKGLNPLLLLSFLIFPPLIISLSLFYTFERPQAFSFLLSLAVFILLEGSGTEQSSRASEQQEGSSPPLAILPLIMLLWANLHGGYIVGVAIIGLYMVGEALNLAVRRFEISNLRFIKRPGFKTTKPTLISAGLFFAVCAFSILVTFFNPGGYSLLWGWLKGFPSGVISAGVTEKAGVVITQISEYQSLWYFYKVLHYKWPIYMIAFISLSLIMLAIKYISLRRVDFRELLAVSFISFLGVYYARGVTFALILLSVVICNCLIAIKGLKWFRVYRLVPALAGALITVVMLVNVLKTTPWELKPKIPQEWLNEIYPEGAIQFLQAYGVKGPIFNELVWGGYLIWRTYPDYRVFIDGRLISGDIRSMYMTVMRGLPEWESVLDKFDINFLLIPVMSREEFSIFPIIIKLLKDRADKWRLVYLYNNTAVFVRNHERNKGVISANSIPQSMVYKEIVDMSDMLLILMPGHPDALLSKAIGLYYLHRYHEAKEILIRLPETPLSKYLLQTLKNY